MDDRDRVLWLLDKHASEFNFPVLDNAYLDFGAARLTAARSPDNWLISFEVLSFSVREILFVNDLYAYGPCVELGGLIGEEVPFTSASEAPIFDPQTNECIANWKDWAISLGGRTHHFSPTMEDYARAGLHIDAEPLPGSLSEADLLHYLVFRLGEQLFLSDQTILARIPKCRGLSKFLQTTRWQHPDVAAGEKPSDSVSIRTLIEALIKGDPSHFDAGRINSYWQFWANKPRVAPP